MLPNIDWDEIDWDKDNGVFINKVKLSKLLLATREREAINEKTSSENIALAVRETATAEMQVWESHRCNRFVTKR